MLRQFPFRIRGFHSDSGLVETNNGAVIRKHIGFGHIQAAHAEPIQSFYAEHFNPYLNFHRPGAQADTEIDAKVCIRHRYKGYQTPLETLLGLEQPAQYLRSGLELATLTRIAGALSDTDAAQRMQHAKATLFDRLRLTG